MILGISRSTVIKHIAAAREKLGAVKNAHAIAKAIRTKLMRWDAPIRSAADP